MSVNLRPRYERSWQVEALGTPKFSKAIGANVILYRPSKPAYFTSMRDAVSSAAAPAPQEAAEMYESANGRMTVTSQHSAFPFFQGTRESPSGRFPSERSREACRFLNDGNASCWKATGNQVQIMVSDCLAGCVLANKAMEASSINH